MVVVGGGVAVPNASNGKYNECAAIIAEFPQAKTYGIGTLRVRRNSVFAVHDASRWWSRCLIRSWTPCHSWGRATILGLTPSAPCGSYYEDIHRCFCPVCWMKPMLLDEAAVHLVVVVAVETILHFWLSRGFRARQRSAAVVLYLDLIRWVR